MGRRAVVGLKEKADIFSTNSGEAETATTTIATLERKFSRDNDAFFGDATLEEEEQNDDDDDDDDDGEGGNRNFAIVAPMPV